MTKKLTIRQVMQCAPVMPVLVIDRAEEALPLAEALLSGGLNVVEITLRTSSALAVSYTHLTLPTIYSV